MTTFDNLYIIFRINFWSAIIIKLSCLRVGRQEIYLSKELSGFKYTAAALCQLGSNVEKELVFEFNASVLSTKHLALKFLQLRGDKALRVDQGLFPDI